MIHYDFYKETLQTLMSLSLIEIDKTNYKIHTVFQLSFGAEYKDA